MAFSKKAEAVVVHPRISSRGWGGIRKAASTSSTSQNLTDQARNILGGAIDPNDYLFTHCTIVASVDTDTVPDVKLGNVKVGSKTVDRRYADYHIKPQCSQFVNNNGDSWSREVLRLAYPTFIGAHNFREHVQIEEQSKGRIIDAVARDIGDSLYVDILVATHKKHAALVQDIQSGKMATLSMGCTTDFTICSQCGHFAVDETQLCDHIKYAKLNTFMDDAGQKRVVAELCGHHTYDENPDAPGGVKFIEASWVAVPAFPGAVMRNIIDPEQSAAVEPTLRKVMATPASQWSDAAVQKAASLASSRLAFEFGGGDEEEGGEEEGEKEAPPFSQLENSVYDLVLNRVKDRLESQLVEDKEEPQEELPAATEPNDSIIKEGSSTRYAAALNTLVRVASSDAALVEGVLRINESYAVQVSPRVYRAVLKAGSLSSYRSRSHFVNACRKSAGRDFTSAELRVVVRVGTLLSAWESANNPDPC